MDWEQFLASMAGEVIRGVRPILGTAEAARAAGRGKGGDISKHVDLVAEEIILDGLKETGLPLHVVTEEAGELYLNVDGDEAGSIDVAYHVIVDPIDGSLNAANGFPISAVSIAVSDGPLARDIFAGVIANVYSGDVIVGTRGGGARVNGRLVHANGIKRLYDAVVSIYVNPRGGSGRRLDHFIDHEDIINMPRKIRVSGCNALNTAFVGTGTLDAFVDIKGELRLLDIAAAWLVVKEGGGIIRHRSGDGLVPIDDFPVSIDTKVNVVACCTPELLDDVARHLPRPGPHPRPRPGSNPRLNPRSEDC